jgi:hypothetical protein
MVKQFNGKNLKGQLQIAIKKNVCPGACSNKAGKKEIMNKRHLL